MADDSAASKAGLNEPLLPPAFEVSDNNTGAYALLTAVIMIVIAGLAICVKLQMTAATFRKLRLDDVALIAALMFGLGYTIAICRAVRYGLGSVAAELTSTQVRLLSQHYYASNILLYLSLASSKCSVALLVIAFKPARWISLTLYSTLAITISWAIAATCVVALQCEPNRWAFGPTSNDICIHQFESQIALRTIDIVIDVVLSVLPAIMMAGVQVSTVKRLIVAFMFAIRLATPVFTAYAIASLDDFYGATVAGRPNKLVAPSIWNSVAVNVSLITACLPSIKRFLTDWAAGIANAGMVEPYELQSSVDRSKIGQSYGNRSFARFQTRSNDMMKSDRAAGVSYSDYASREKDDQDRGADDGDSKKGLTDGIMKTIDYHIEYDKVRKRREGSMSSEVKESSDEGNHEIQHIP
ncbi:hypothetical protein LTR37_016306 [Vermiconidia calcicola]|uniref:Uncharacterized protein n=1 Tax=Vermiconidia calcicola TaxID=1690605 RepID=A0ACC3MNG6_9PEZI|nr:hypothetical protein LTR37_016306 [Vermiconidia calcicola]